MKIKKKIYVLMFEFIDVDQFLVFDSLFVLEKKPVSPKIRDQTYQFFFVDFISDASYKCNRIPEIPI